MAADELDQLLDEAFAAAESDAPFDDDHWRRAFARAWSAPDLIRIIDRFELALASLVDAEDLDAATTTAERLAKIIERLRIEPTSAFEAQQHERLLGTVSTPHERTEPSGPTMSPWAVRSL